MFLPLQGDIGRGDLVAPQMARLCLGHPAARRGPSGVIGTNKPDASDVAARLLAECKADPAKAGRSRLSSHLTSIGCRWVAQDGWRRIDAHERRSARPGAPRRKLARIEDMLAIGQA